MELLNRRKFISKTGLTFGSLLAAPFFSRLSWADVPPGSIPDKFFLMINTHGGMDVTLGIDPWVLPADAAATDMFIEYTPDKILDPLGQGKLKFAPGAQPLAPFADHISVINGVLMSDVDNGHPVLNNYMATGSGQGKAPSLPVEMCVCSDSGSFGVITNNVLNLAGRKVTVSKTDVLQNSESSLDYLKLIEGTPVDGDKSPVDQAKQAILDSKDTATKFYKILGDFKTKYFALNDNHVVAAGFLAGASMQGYLDIGSAGGNLDTHVDHPINHLKTQTDVWSKVAETLKLFKETPFGAAGESLLDRVTIIVISEFSRTPALNGAQGKDHNPFTNSVLLAGRGVKGGNTFGASSLIKRKDSPRGLPLHMALPIDYKAGGVLHLQATGDVPPNTDFIFPENVIRTVAEIAGADLAKFHSTARSVLPIPGLV